MAAAGLGVEVIEGQTGTEALVEAVESQRPRDDLLTPHWCMEVGDISLSCLTTPPFNPVNRVQRKIQTPKSKKSPKIIEL